ncbi:MAG: hypothetical protein ABW022_24075, partial [Actinoplanes sp.]
MRVFRTILGMLLLTIGLPALLAGGALWAVGQHRDQGGAFSGELQRLSTPGYAFVVTDVDALLRTDAPFTRIGDSQLRLTARTQDGPAFVGLAPSAEVTRYLTGVPHSTVRTVDIGTGALPVATTAVGGRTAPAVLPGRSPIWIRTDVDGSLAWSPGEVRGGPYSLVVMNPGAKPGLRLTTVAELRPGWLNSSTWGLLTLGTLLVMIGMLVLAWPARRREIIYVVEPSQVPELIAAIGGPLPLKRIVGWPAGAHRPRTLADAQPAALAAAPQLAWPPALAAGPASSSSAAASAAAASSAAQPEAVSASGAVDLKPAPASRPVPPSAEEYAAATAIPARPTGDRRPAPGEPLSFIGASSATGPASSPLGETPPESVVGRRPAKPAPRRRTNETADLPLFQSTAVDAWVA